MPATVYDYFQSALQHAPAPATGAEYERDSEGHCVSFLLVVRDGRIVRAQFRSTTCVTLLGLCEHLREAVSGLTIDAAARITAVDLLSCHPEIPSMRRGRAELAVRALRSALQFSSGDTP